MKSLRMQTNAILYARLSREDEGSKVSTSIKNQIDILSNYAIVNGFRIIDICYDDGFSGGNFDRPGFKKMMEYIDSGTANVIIVKDLSRFGRDFLGVSAYIDEYFVDNHIRFISINDDYDSAIATEDFSIVLKNFINGLYLKEFKKKTRLGIDNKAMKETLKSTGCYGYFCKNGKLEIDYEVAPIVVRIFDEYISGKTAIEICRGLNEDKIDPPALHKFKILGISHAWKYEPKWKTHAIHQIIKRREYIGDVINQQYRYINGKEKKNDNPIILENMHEPIIDRDTFFKANNKIKIMKKTSKEILDKLVSDLIRTSNDRKVYYAFKITNPATNKRSEYYENKKDNILIRIDYLHKVLYEYSLSYVKKILKNKEEYKNELLRYLIENSNHEKRLKQINTELAEIDNLFSKIFEQYAFEEITFEEYEEKRIYYSNKQVLLTREKDELLTNNITVYEINKKVESFMDSINKKTLKMNEVDLIRLCIKKVIVKRVDKNYDIKIIDVFS